MAISFQLKRGPSANLGNITTIRDGELVWLTDEKRFRIGKNDGSTQSWEVLNYASLDTAGKIPVAQIPDLGLGDGSLGGLSDVDFSGVTLSDDHYLGYDAAAGKWVAIEKEEASINDLTDVDTNTITPTNGQVLKWDGSKWVPADDSAVDSLNDISDVNVTNVTDGQIIVWDATSGEWQASDLPTGVDGTFKGLTDTPNDYAGSADKLLAVSSTEDGVVFKSITSDDVTEGTTNLYYTDARADARVQAAIDDTAGTGDTTKLLSADQIMKRLTSGATYLGLWDADGNGGAGSPSLANGTGDNGDFYIVRTGGDASFDGGTTTITFQEGDRVVFNANAGTSGEWQKVVSADAVDSVNGKTGVVTLNTDDIDEGTTNLYYTDARVGTYLSGTAKLTDISDVDTGATNNQILAWDDANSKWTPVDPGSVTSTTFVSLSDTPSAYNAGDAGKFVRVNSAEDAVEFTTAAIGDLSDVDGAAATSGQVLKWDGSKWAPADDADTLYTAGTGISITNNEIALNASVNDLTDVDTATTTPSTDDVLAWDGSNWVPTAIDGGEF